MRRWVDLLSDQNNTYNDTDRGDIRDRQAQFVLGGFTGIYPFDLGAGHYLAVYRNTRYGESERPGYERLLAGDTLAGVVPFFAGVSETWVQLLPRHRAVNRTDDRVLLVDGVGPELFQHTVVNSTCTDSNPWLCDAAR